ncbi:hypothetical protein ACIBTV_27825 [Micromonospora sp. NPDC049366]|uniref:hypothetical protein n=1 Tax=Micromonospora sp. NPDC049366 TaxID=3364271 RepID=UPI0037A14524
MALHEIPADDGAEHAPTSECGCGPARVPRGRRFVYVHVDQRPDQQDRGPADGHE